MRLLPLLLPAVVLTASCQDATPGAMTSQTYRSLDARGDALTPDAARESGAVDDDALARTFVAEGGAAAPAGASCLYARTTWRDAYRGTARFCFDGDRVVSVERNRADLAER